MSDEFEKVDLPWLTAAVDQRIAQLKSRLPPEGIRLGHDIITMMLTEPEEDATQADIERWQRTCDNCGIYVPPKPTKVQQFYSGTVGRTLLGSQLLISFGACARCAGKR